MVFQPGNIVKAMKFVTVTADPFLSWRLAAPSLSQPGIIRAGGGVKTPGGSGIGISRVLQMLGEKTVALVPFGGSSGLEFIESAKEEPFAFHPVPVSGTTRYRLVLVDESTEDTMEIDTPGSPLSESDWQSLLREASDICSEGDWAVAAGPLAPGIPDDFYRFLSGRLRERGAMMALDASGAPLERALHYKGILRPHIVKMTIAGLSGLWRAALSSLDEIWAQGYRFPEGPEFLISHDSEGALVLSRNGCWEGRSLHAGAHCRGGGEDALLAGYVLMRQRGSHEPDALKHALACADASDALPPGRSLDSGLIKSSLSAIEIRRKG
ncbi:MAG: PfkB family carbohydrate kinase [Candidatus Eremiobacteraeota bacterium]|nr:PfkB family carbohydrate kinase [Candidatus Eremiobacteraeota bacterium]